jgi:photosystem II stability/assembly factor-like uncharacterized protein
MKKLLLLALLIIFNFSLFTSYSHTQWIKQNWPVFENVKGVSFFNANTGLVAMKTYPAGYYALYRTTNAGFNWTENYKPKGWLYQMQKINDSIVYVLGDNRSQYLIYRSFNRGLSWDSIIYPSIDGMYFINKDTGWAAMFSGNSMGYYRTDNGGITFSLLSSFPASGSYEVELFFLKQKYNGNYFGYRSFLSSVKKTTDGGYTWIDLPGLPGTDNAIINEISQITFINKDTGWVANQTNKIYKTTNGGNNWSVYYLPSNFVFTSYATNFYIINKDTLFLAGGDKYYGGTQLYGIVFKTTNGGLNWGYQQPDTATNPKWGYFAPSFINELTGWFSNIYTTNKGGPIIYTEIKNIFVEKPDEFKLYQNYPNPFNPNTTIDFYLPEKAKVSLLIFDISGRTVLRVVDNFYLTNGYHSFKVDAFNTLEISSGIYFYKLTATNKTGKQQYSETKRMIYLK